MKFSVLVAHIGCQLTIRDGDEVLAQYHTDGWHGRKGLFFIDFDVPLTAEVVATLHGPVAVLDFGIPFHDQGAGI